MAEGPNHNGASCVQSNGTNRKLLYSRYCPVKIIPSIYLFGGDGFFTCVKYMPKDKTILVGSSKGKILEFDIVSGERNEFFNAESCQILHIEPSKTGEFILSSARSQENSYVSHLWHVEDAAARLTLDEQKHVEFGKVSQGLILGTKGKVATMYDAATGSAISTYSPIESNGYTKNKATFSMDDRLILTDGVLFNVRSGQQVYRFPSSNDTQSEVFHPDGSKIISNTYIYDMRMNGLLQTIPIIDHCNVIYSSEAIYLRQLPRFSATGIRYAISFIAADVADYSSIASVNVGRHIFDLDLNSSENQIAVLGNAGPNGGWPSQSVIQLLDVGKPTDHEDRDHSDLIKLSITPL